MRPAAKNTVYKFQSTLSMRRATDGILQREDGSFDFNPRSP